MKLSWPQLIARTKAESVGGDVIAVIDGRRQSIGRKRAGEFFPSLLGERLAHELAVEKPKRVASSPPTVQVVTAPAPRKRNQRKRPKYATPYNPLPPEEPTDA